MNGLIRSNGRYRSIVWDAENESDHGESSYEDLMELVGETDMDSKEEKYALDLIRAIIESKRTAEEERRRHPRAPGSESETEVPHHLKDPISLCLMKDPVLVPQFDHTFDREWLERLLRDEVTVEKPEPKGCRCVCSAPFRMFIQFLWRGDYELSLFLSLSLSLSVN